MRKLRLLSFLAAACAAPLLADVTTFAGHFEALGLAPQYDYYAGVFVLAAPGDVTITSSGYALGGFDSIMSVFQGTGPDAVYLGLGAETFDPTLTLNSLPAGAYTLAITYQSNAPNAYYGAGTTLGDGFISLGWVDTSRTDYFQIDVAADHLATVPEPSAVVLCAAAAMSLLTLRRHRAMARARS